MTQKIVLIGAGSASFGLGTLGEILRSKVFAGSHIVLHDINPQSLQRIEIIGRDYIEKNNLPYTLTATTSPKEALQGASSV